jgi:hypothetical protein
MALVSSNKTKMTFAGVTSYLLSGSDRRCRPKTTRVAAAAIAMICVRRSDLVIRRFIPGCSFVID